MPDRTQEIKNLRAVAVASKNYIDKSIENLKWELGTYDLSVESDTTSALVKTMPSGTIKLNVNKIYGASEVSENLCPTATYNDVMNNTIAKTIDLGNLPNGTYTISFNVLANADDRTFIIYYANSGVVDSENNISTLSKGTGQKSYTFTLDGTISYDDIRLGINTGTLNYSIELKDLMLVKGSTAPTTFKPYYSGIHNLELSGVKVEGANLLDVSSITFNNGKGLNSSGVEYNNNTMKSSTYIDISNMLESGETYYLWINTGNESGLRIWQYASDYSTIEQNSTSVATATRITFTLNANTKYIRFSSNLIETNLGIFKVLPTEFIPYIAPTNLPIDLSTILYNGSPLFDGNSLKGVGTAKDSVTPYLATKKIQQYVVTNDTEITKSQEDSGNGIGARIIVPSNVKINGLILSSLQNYSQITYNSFYTGQQVGFASHNISANNVIYIRLGADYDTIQKVKDYLVNNNAIFNFELETPIEVSIDWSSTLRGITGYSNGSITAQNTHNMDVPSDIDYLIEEVKA